MRLGVVRRTVRVSDELVDEVTSRVARVPLELPHIKQSGHWQDLPCVGGRKGRVLEQRAEERVHFVLSPFSRYRVVPSDKHYVMRGLVMRDAHD